MDIANSLLRAGRYDEARDVRRGLSSSIPLRRLRATWAGAHPEGSGRAGNRRLEGPFP